MIRYQIYKGFLVPTFTDDSGRGPDGKTLLTTTEAAEHFSTDARTIEEVARAFADGSATDYRDTPPVLPLGDNDRLKILRRVKFAHLSDEHFDLLRAECADRGLSLWGRQVHAELRWTAGKRKPELIIIVTIDAIRALAEATGEYGGQLGPWWCGPDGIWKECWTAKEYPTAAKVGIVRKGIKEPFWGIARWESYVPYVEINDRMEVAEFWHRMAPEMLCKTAEALGFRRAFPKPLNNLYSREEMAQMKNPIYSNQLSVNLDTGNAAESGSRMRFVPDGENAPKAW